MRLRLAVLSLALLALVWNENAVAGVPLKADAPDRVEVGVWLGGLHSINYIEGSFVAEFYIWWIGDNPDFHPFDVLQILNGRDWAVRSVSRRELPDGRIHTSGFVSVTINHDWDLRYYPFDRQSLQIIIETPYTSSELQILPRQEKSALSKLLKVQGYAIHGLELSAQTEGYDTDFGIESATSKQYSRVVMTVEMQRQSERLAVVLLLGFIVANLIALFTYAIEVSMIGTRASMITAAVFAAVGNMSLVSDEVNPAVGSLIVDGFALGTFASIVIALLLGIIVHRLVQWKKISLARIINWTVFAVVIIVLGIYYPALFHAAIK